MKALILLLAWLLFSLPLFARGDAVEFNGTRYRTFTAPANWVQVFWKGPDGKPFRQLVQLQAFLKSQPGRVRMMMNAGIFKPDGVPSGLAVSKGVIQNALNTADGKGNFFLKPTGVFYVDDEGAHVVTTDEYARMKVVPRAATQSGPILLRDGKMHPKFNAGSTSRLHRNGVGILPDGRVLFVITEFDQAKRPNFYEFASFFVSRGCRDALFLDGDLSQMEVDPTSSLTPGNFFGALITVIEPVEEK